MNDSVLLYKFCSEPVALMNLAMRRIRGARMDYQNDLFEMDSHDCAPEHREVWDGYIQQICSAWRSVSLCRSNSSPVTWAHYGDSNRGICLGLRVKKDLVIGANYVETRPRIDLFEYLALSDTERQSDALQVVFTKSRDWAYEEESRLIFTVVEPEEGGYSYQRFNGDFRIEQVILGARCPTPPSVVRMALDGMGYPDVELFKASKSKVRFAIDCLPCQT